MDCAGPRSASRALARDEGPAAVLAMTVYGVVDASMRAMSGPDGMAIPLRVVRWRRGRGGDAGLRLSLVLIRGARQARALNAGTRACQKLLCGDGTRCARLHGRNALIGAYGQAVPLASACPVDNSRPGSRRTGGAVG